MVQSLLYSETYESVYGKDREGGHALLADYCKKKVHLQVPKPESLLKVKGPLPLGPKTVEPVEAKPKVNYIQTLLSKVKGKCFRSIAGMEIQECSYQLPSSADGESDPVFCVKSGSLFFISSGCHKQ